MLTSWLIFGVLILPFILVCVFLWLNVKLLTLQHLVQEDISRLEQKYYYLEKLLLLLTSSNSVKDIGFDDLLKIIIDKTDDRTNFERYSVFNKRK